MKCSLCGLNFDETMAQAACSGCGLVKKCDLIRCPRCNFEMAPEPKWVRKIKDWRRKTDDIVG